MTAGGGGGGGEGVDVGAGVGRAGTTVGGLTMATVGPLAGGLAAPSLGEGESDGVPVGDGAGGTSALGAAATTCPELEAVLAAPGDGARANAGGSVVIRARTTRARPAFRSVDHWGRNLPRAEVSQRRPHADPRLPAGEESCGVFRRRRTASVANGSADSPSRFTRAQTHQPKRRAKAKTIPA